MRPGEAVALAEKYQAHILEQTEWFQTRLPATAPGYIRWHVEDSLDLPEADRTIQAPQRTTLIERLNRLSYNASVQLAFSGQDMGTLALWQQHRIVYSIDDEVWRSLGDTGDDYVIPEGLFRYLPHPDPFIAFPEPLVLTTEDGKLHRIGGCFLTGRSSRREGHGPALVGMGQRTTSVSDLVGLGLLFVGPVYWPDGRPYMTSDGRTQDVIYSRTSLHVGETVGVLIVGAVARYLATDETVAWMERLPMMIRRALSVIVYLCATNADLRPVTAAPPKRKGKGGGRTVRNDTAPRVVEVGYRVGAELRAWRRGEPGAGHVPGRTVRPHIRRAHFHTFKVGPGRAESRVRWLAPIPVRFLGPAPTPTVIRTGPHQPDPSPSDHNTSGVMLQG
jgi:hypothetical protein